MGFLILLFSIIAFITCPSLRNRLSDKTDEIRSIVTADLVSITITMGLGAILVPNVSKRLQVIAEEIDIPVIDLVRVGITYSLVVCLLVGGFWLFSHMARRPKSRLDIKVFAGILNKYLNLTAVSLTMFTIGIVRIITATSELNVMETVTSFKDPMLNNSETAAYMWHSLVTVFALYLETIQIAGLAYVYLVARLLCLLFLVRIAPTIGKKLEERKIFNQLNSILNKAAADVYEKQVK